MANYPETLVLPGFVDLHTHLREPSPVNKSETIANGSRTALLGGFEVVCDMPNNPGNPTWSEAKVDEKHEIIDRDAYNRVWLWSGAQPEADNVGELERMLMKTVGVKLYGSPNVSDYSDYAVEDFREVVEEVHRINPNKVIAFHRGDSDLEEFIAMTAKEIGQPVHVCHTNHPDEVEIVKKAKAEGLRVSIGVCLHHLVKTSHDRLTQGWFIRMLPELAHQVDAEKLLYLLARGDIDNVETDYAPHPKEAKWKAEIENPEGEHGPHSTHSTCYGVPGIEHVVPILFRQVNLGNISMSRLVDAMHTKPLQILGTSLPPSEFTWQMDNFRIEDEATQVHSGTGWTPYLGMLATGRLLEASINGKTVVERGVVIKREGVQKL